VISERRKAKDEKLELSVWEFLRRLIGFSGWLYGFNVVLWIGVMTLPLVPGYVSKLFFDALENKNPVWNGIPYTIQGIIVLVGCFAVLQVANIFLAIVANIPWRFRSSGLLRQNLLRRLLCMPGAKAFSGTLGENLNTLRDDAGEAEDASDWTLDVIGQTVYIVIAIAILVSIDAELTLFVFLPLLLVTIGSYQLRRQLEGLQKAAREKSSHYTSLLGEIYQSVQAIQVAGAEKSVLNALEIRSQARQAAMLKNVALNQALTVFSNNIVALGTGLILLLVGGKMKSGEFTVGEFSLFVLYLWEVGNHTEFFGRFVATVQRAAVAFGRMTKLMQGAPALALVAPRVADLDVRRVAAPLAPRVRQTSDELQTLEVRDLRHIHGDSGRGLETASFTVQRGEFVVVTGRIGSGKTTLLRTVLGLLPAQSGWVLWNGKEVLDVAEFMQPPRSAYTPQVPTLLSGTVLENIQLGAEAGAIENAVRQAVLEADLEQLPKHLETLVGVKGLKLSGGQLQRTAAARMFAQDSSLLVLDDISSALDVKTEELLWQRIATVQKTCLVVSHRRPALQRADRIVLLEQGRVTNVGSLEELLVRSSEMRRLWAGEV
jgi:ATP-binding cassette, subfamily B, bacterial